MDDTRRVPDLDPSDASPESGHGPSPVLRRNAWDEEDELWKHLDPVQDASASGNPPYVPAPSPEPSEKAKQWNTDHADAVETWTRWIEENGMPYERLDRG